MFYNTDLNSIVVSLKKLPSVENRIFWSICQEKSKLTESTYFNIVDLRSATRCN